MLSPGLFGRHYIACPMSGCWLWTGAADAKGYGRMHGNRKAHRVSYELHVGKIPDGMCVLHKCDVPACVRPDHLFLGTQLDNMRDMFAKGRRPPPSGERHPRARLTNKDVVSIRQRKAAGESNRDLAREYNMWPETIARLCAGKTWKHISSLTEGHSQ